MAWVYIFIAGILECAWAVGLKYTDGFTKPVPSILTLIGVVLSFWFMALAMKELPLGTAYAVWTGIGAVGVAILGMILFGESRDILRIFCLVLIFSGIIGLKLTS